MAWLKNRQLRIRAAAFAVYVLVALWATWPLATRPVSHFQQGSMTSPTVPLFNIWTAWWNSDRALHFGRGYWDSPVFFPERNTFALSEPQPTMLLVAPVIWVTGSRVLAYNVYLWLSLILNGVFAARLLRQLGSARLIATAGGIAMMLLPYVHWQRDVIQLVPVWGILWTLSCVLRITRTPSWKIGAETGVAFSLTCLSCLHYGLFLVIPLGLGSLVLVHWKKCLPVLAAGCVAVVVACVLVGPFAWTIRRETSGERFTRGETTVERQSAEVIDYVSSRNGQWLAFHPQDARNGRGLSVGWMSSLLAITGLIAALRFRRSRRMGLCLLVVGLSAFLMSLGPNLKIGTWEPWWTLTGALPIFGRVRNVFRFAVLVQIVLIVFAFAALHYAIAIARTKTLSLATRRVVLATVTILAVVATCETPPPTVRLSEAPDASAHRAWTEFVNQNVAAGRGVICLPMSSGTKVSSFASTAEWMYLGTYHKQPLLNGYSGYFPTRFFYMRREIGDGFPTVETLKLLAGSHVDLVVVDRNEFQLGEISGSDESDSARLELVFSDEVGIDVYRITTEPTAQDSR